MRGEATIHRVQCSDIYIVSYTTASQEWADELESYFGRGDYTNLRYGDIELNWTFETRDDAEMFAATVNKYKEEN